MDLSGFIVFERNRLKGLSKKQLADQAIPEDVTYDMALPQDWVDSFVHWAGLQKNYHVVLSTTFMVYSQKRGFPYGFPWSACREIQDLIQLFMAQGQHLSSASIKKDKCCLRLLFDNGMVHKIYLDKEHVDYTNKVLTAEWVLSPLDGKSTTFNALVNW